MEPGSQPADTGRSPTPTSPNTIRKSDPNPITAGPKARRKIEASSHLAEQTPISSGLIRWGTSSRRNWASCWHLRGPGRSGGLPAPESGSMTLEV